MSATVLQLVVLAMLGKRGGEYRATPLPPALRDRQNALGSSGLLRLAGGMGGPFTHRVIL